MMQCTRSIARRSQRGLKMLVSGSRIDPSPEFRSCEFVNEQTVADSSDAVQILVPTPPPKRQTMLSRIPRRQSSISSTLSG